MIKLDFTPPTRNADTSVDITKIKCLTVNDEGYCRVALTNGQFLETRDPIHLVEARLNHLLRQKELQEQPK